ncbi:MAG: Lon-like protease [Actinomycetota bacterium]|nr:Lon-like protease [Actinomycetota bacterium]
MLAGQLVKVPYYVLSPGNATAVEPLVKVDGAPSFQHQGQVLFTTVSLLGDANVLAVLRGWLSRDDAVVSQRDITGGTPRKTYDQENVQAMTDSKLTATKVALQRLGYPVTAHGSGVAVVQVTPQGPADGKLRTGDVITAVDGVAVTLAEELVSAVGRRKPGDTVVFTVGRTGGTQTVEVRAGDDGKGRPRVGIGLQTQDLRYDSPVKVSIDTGQVGGPSAGLAFTLALIDDLSAGDLTGGRKVAVTGTIDDQGRVGPVGGAAQKAVTARRAGAVAFLVPPDEEHDAKRHAGSMRVITVRTVDDALAALAQLGGSTPGLPTTTTTTQPTTTTTTRPTTTTSTAGRH